MPCLLKNSFPVTPGIIIENLLQERGMSTHEQETLEGLRAYYVESFLNHLDGF